MCRREINLRNCQWKGCKSIAINKGVKNGQRVGGRYVVGVVGRIGMGGGCGFWVGCNDNGGGGGVMLLAL
ncbi:hypothetical protein UF30_00125 [Vibrio parahaemolyticus]|nr:hypothetical protein UF30_00125 [Vibrio parahaemolyticus]